jgi:hypothetical protein
MLKVSWVDASGHFFHARARCLDASAKGLRVQLDQRLDSSCYVNIKAEKFGLIASARVRRCLQKGREYHISLEFNAGATWDRLPEPAAVLQSR